MKSKAVPALQVLQLLTVSNNCALVQRLTLVMYSAAHGPMTMMTMCPMPGPWPSPSNDYVRTTKSSSTSSSSKY